jgi:hypothetical protein
MTSYLIGYGVGRCGTKSLAHLLSSQGGVTAYHEAMPLHWLPSPGYGSAIDWLKHINNDVVCAVGYYWLKYVPMVVRELCPVKFVHIWREKEEVVESFWNKKTRIRGMEVEDDEWFGVYPFLDYPPTKDKIAKTWEKYQYIAGRMAKFYSNITHTLHMNDLNDMAKVSALLDFVDIPKEQQVLERVHLNKGKDKCLKP